MMKARWLVLLISILNMIFRQNSNLTDLTNALQYPLVYKGTITGDLNRLTITPGYYMIGASGTISNAPSGTEYTLFIQFYGYNAQAIFNAGLKSRRYVGNPATWSSWI